MSRCITLMEPQRHWKSVTVIATKFWGVSELLADCLHTHAQADGGRNPSEFCLRCRDSVRVEAPAIEFSRRNGGGSRMTQTKMWRVRIYDTAALLEAEWLRLFEQLSGCRR